MLAKKMFSKLGYTKVEETEEKIIYEKIIYEKIILYPDNPHAERKIIMFNKNWKQIWSGHYDFFEDIEHGAILEYEEIKAINKQIKELENETSRTTK